MIQNGLSPATATSFGSSQAGGKVTYNAQRISPAGFGCATALWPLARRKDATRASTTRVARVEPPCRCICPPPYSLAIFQCPLSLWERVRVRGFSSGATGPLARLRRRRAVRPFPWGEGARGLLAVLSPRLDIRIQAEEVRRVIRVLQGHQPFVVVAIGQSDAVVTIVEAQFVDVDAHASEAMDRLPELASPVDVLVTFRGILPLRRNKELMRMRAVGESGL